MKNKMQKKEKSQGADISTNVSTLKTHLGQYLKKVKQGLEVIVYDRQLPVAKLIAFNGDGEKLIEVAPKVSWGEVERELAHNTKKRSASNLKKKSLHYLGEDRGHR